MRVYLDLLQRILDKGVTVQTGAYLPSERRQPAAKRLHAEQIQFDLSVGFPAVTTKPLWWRAVVVEWLWFMQGSGNIQFLRDHKINSIWEPWVKKNPDGTENGDLGPVYGRQFRHYQGVRWQDRPDVQPVVGHEVLLDEGILIHPEYTGDPGNKSRTCDQIAYRGYRYLIVGDRQRPCYVVNLGPYHNIIEVDQIAQARDDIRAVVANPFDRVRRRIIVTLWNPTQIEAMALPPCHTFHMYDLEPPKYSPDEAYEIKQGNHPDDGKWTLNLHLIARSIDAVKGLPFNIASYALMCHVMAAITRTKPGTLTITFNDVHIYDNQFADVEEQLQRKPLPLPSFTLEPTGADTDKRNFLDICSDLTIEQAHQLEPSRFKLIGYQHHPRLQSESEIAV